MTVTIHHNFGERHLAVRDMGGWATYFTDRQAFYPLRIHSRRMLCNASHGRLVEKTKKSGHLAAHTKQLFGLVWLAHSFSWSWRVYWDLLACDRPSLASVCYGAGRPRKVVFILLVGTNLLSGIAWGGML